MPLNHRDTELRKEKKS